MDILITNDDGITSGALYLLRQELKDLGRVFIVAPDRDQSATSHSLTLYRPMRIERPEAGVFAVDGTPTDCVLIAAHGLLERAPEPAARRALRLRFVELLDRPVNGLPEPRIEGLPRRDTPYQQAELPPSLRVDHRRARHPHT